MGRGSYYIETYGCSLAEFDSSLMEAKLSEAGYVRVESVDEAEYVLVNTCAVRLDTEQRISERLLELKSKYPNRKYIVAGCLVKARPGLVSRLAPGASLLSPQNVHRVVEAFKALEGGSRLQALDGSRDTSTLPTLRPSGVTATIMVQEGCLGDCSFCITKIARRNVKSYPPRLIVDVVGKLVSMGVVEVRLTGLDTAAYGVDLPGRPTLADLVNAILDKVEGDYMVRVGMMTPELASEILDDLIESYRDPRVYKYFHIPVQSGDDEVLRIMNRKYTVDDYKKIHYKIKTSYPEAMIATDIIVGHPGEDEEAFQNTVKLVEELKFEKVHLAQYSIRPHTRAAAMPQIPDWVKKERSKKLGKIVEEIGYKIMSKYRGKTLEVLVTEEGFRKGSLTGRTYNYIPVVLEHEENILGSKALVAVKENTFFDLRGELLEVVKPPRTLERTTPASKILFEY
ncbi:MAG: tRNA (N(6)-L-threonylcarbamoyladenosine(37)-C(2))-methylthiotransferase [Thermoprotei archaeon]|nr:tRNA (N(6)-L-threonylcarbamoyladenosine(37)-C(2))-methylthiotransferase [Thermoprotei archaeon]